MNGKKWILAAVIVILMALAAGAGWMIARLSLPVYEAEATTDLETDQQLRNPISAPAFEEALALAGESVTTRAASAPATVLSAEQAGTAPAAAETQPTSRPLANGSNADALADFDKGIALLKNDPIGARYALSEALLSGKLPQQQEAKAMEELTKLSEDTILSGSIVEDDPYTFYYMIEPGDVLARLERRLELHVPWQILLKINQIDRPEDIKVGQRMKMIRGPFHAVVSKSNFTMDIFLHRETLPRVWVARIKCGLGKNGSTPVGMWRVGGGEGKRGGKLVHPTWNPPPSSITQGPINYGQEGYALGSKGLWIGLVGTDENTVSAQNYGIHSTSNQSSIGKEESLGCIRLADNAIELAYSLLYEVWSTVQTRE